MKNYWRRISCLAFALALIMLSTAPSLHAETATETEHKCAPGAPGPALRVLVHGFKDRKGNMRLQLYSAQKEEFLAPGKKLLAAGKLFYRVETPVTPSGDVEVCIPLPGMGHYSLVVLHDRDANNKLSIWSDGVGFSNNPKLGLAKPDVSKVAFAAPSGVADMRIILNYRSGFSVRPLQGGE